MAEIKKSALFPKLTPQSYKALEAGVVTCKLRGNPYVELAHWLDQLLRQPELDTAHIVRAFELKPERLAMDTIKALDKLPRGATSISSFSKHITDALEQAFLWSAVYFDSTRIRSGHLLVGLLKDEALRGILVGISPEFERISGDRLAEEFSKVVANSAEEIAVAEPAGAGAPPGAAAEAIPPPEMGKQEAIRRFTTDLTEKARKGEIDPIVGRDVEIRLCVDILMRRRQNNPILIGEAGVGKTAVVEGFVHRILAGAVPPALHGVSVRALDVGLLQAGASMKGEFEQRLRGVIDEIQASPKPIILFIDEAHTLIGAGGAAGTGDAANLLKPALARGTLRTIAATTWDEVHKRHIEKDPALTRRFQVVKVDEPTEDLCVRMMRAVAGPFERYHKVHLHHEALDAAVRLSHRYIVGRQLPDKAVSLIDTACARVAVSQHAVPPEVDDCRRRIQDLETELAILGRDSAIGVDHQELTAELNQKLSGETEALAGLEKHWQEEKELVGKILGLRAKLRPPDPGSSGRLRPTTTVQPSPPEKAAPVPADPVAPAQEPGGTPQPDPAEREKMLTELRDLHARLRTLQGERPLIFPGVDADSIATVVADWTGIPVSRMVKSEVEQVLTLADTLERRVIGQRHALDLIAERIQTSRAQLENPNRPVGVFMLAGPSGTGKTETALALADAVYGGQDSMIAMNMTEYSQEFTVSKIMGPPPGYVGHEDGGVLTNFVQKRPYCVVLLDEFEKAHTNAHRLFMQAFDKGHLEDGKGKHTDFKNTIIILTTNAAQEVIIALCKNPELMPSADGMEQAMREPLKKVFPDALLNRLVVVPFYPISIDVLHRIIRLQLSRIEKRVRDSHKVALSYDESVPELIGQRCTELERGARIVEALISKTILPRIGREVLSRLATGTQIKSVRVGVRDGDFAYTFD